MRMLNTMQVTLARREKAIETLGDKSMALKKNIVVKEVPGSFELVYGCKKMQQQDVDVVIAIGSVIQGETKHFDFVCDGVTQGVKDLNILYDVPVIFCVLTDNNYQQSIERSGGKHGNKGTEAAIVAIQMAEFKCKTQ